MNSQIQRVIVTQTRAELTSSVTLNRNAEISHVQTADAAARCHPETQSLVFKTSAWAQICIWHHSWPSHGIQNQTFWYVSVIVYSCIKHELLFPCSSSSTPEASLYSLACCSTDNSEDVLPLVSHWMQLPTFLLQAKASQRSKMEFLEQKIWSSMVSELHWQQPLHQIL